LLEHGGLADSADRKIATLSGRSAPRLDVAVGIVGRPELLFLDEPTAGFDPQARRDFHDLVHRLARPRGHTTPAHHARPGGGRAAGRPHPHPRGGRSCADGSAEALTRQVAGTPRSAGRDGERFVHPTDDPAGSSAASSSSTAIA
jgi:ABC-2 type transport system ATP-binding protein